MKKHRWLSIRSSIRNRIFFSSMLIVTLLTIIISIRSYQISVDILQDKVSSALQETLNYVGNGVERELNQVEQVSDFIFFNNNIREILNKQYASQNERLNDMYRMDEIFTNYSVSTVFPYIPVIKIFANNGEEYSFGGRVHELDSRSVKEQGIQQALLEHNSTKLWSGVHKEFLQKPFEDLHVVSIFRLIKDEKFANDTGLLYISLDPVVFGNILKRVNLQNRSEIYITDQYDKIVFHSGMEEQYIPIGDVLGTYREKDERGFFVSEAPEGKMLVSSFVINRYGWKVFGTIPMNTLVDENKLIILNNIAVFLVVFIIALVAWYFTLSRITKPLKALTSTMESVGEGNMYVKFECDREDEIGLLARSFNYMMDKMHELFNNLLKEQYKVLQAQINPHFLYNTLNSIRWMAIIHRVDSIKEVIDALSLLIMNSMKSERQFVSIEEEITNLKAYIYIQKIRYNNSFDVEFDIDEQVLNCQCISFILQPQVENAIFHGIEPKEGFGLIQVSVKRENGVIYLTVRDNGVGMTEKQIHRVLNEEKDVGRGLSGIGVRNVNERIKMIYGTQFGIRITSKLKEYTSVEITIPERTEIKALDEAMPEITPGGTNDV